VPGFGCDARVSEHVFEFIDDVIGQGGDQQASDRSFRHCAIFGG
jgi:hypothetical protein